MNFYQIYYIKNCKPVSSRIQAGNILSAIGVLKEDANTVFKVELIWSEVIDVPKEEVG
jgi:hypothetical protein